MSYNPPSSSLYQTLLLPPKNKRLLATLPPIISYIRMLLWYDWKTFVWWKSTSIIIQIWLSPPCPTVDRYLNTSIDWRKISTTFVGIIKELASYKPQERFFLNFIILYI
jgi:hypothetical protein